MNKRKHETNKKENDEGKQAQEITIMKRRSTEENKINRYRNRE